MVVILESPPEGQESLNPQRRKVTAEALLQDEGGCDDKATPMAQVPELQSTLSP